MRSRMAPRIAEWNAAWRRGHRAPRRNALPSDAQVIGAVWRTASRRRDRRLRGGRLPGELHKLWRTARTGGYHVEYGYSCMGYEIAGGLGVKLAAPEREVIVMVGDGSYLMLNSELATSVDAGRKLIVVLLDNRGFGCINRLQQATGGAAFNNLLADRATRLPRSTSSRTRQPGRACRKGREHRRARSRAERAQAPRPHLRRGHRHRPDVAAPKPAARGGTSPSPEVSERAEVNAARKAYERSIGKGTAT